MLFCYEKRELNRFASSASLAKCKCASLSKQLESFCETSAESRVVFLSTLLLRVAYTVVCLKALLKQMLNFGKRRLPY